MNLKHFSKIFWLLFFCFYLLTGCFTQLRIYEDAAISEENVDQIQVGKTTKTEILNLFGPPKEFKHKKFVLDAAINRFLPPLKLNKMNPERVFTYQYRATGGAVFFIILWFYVDRETRSDYLMVFFDENDVVTQFGFAKDLD